MSQRGGVICLLTGSTMSRDQTYDYDQVILAMRPNVAIVANLVYKYEEMRGHHCYKLLLLVQDVLLMASSTYV